VLKWIFERVEGTGKAIETPIGHLPVPDALDLSGLDVSEADIKTLLTVDVEGWKNELDGLAEYYDQFGDRLPAALRNRLNIIRERLAKA
jgi:phosphoenolpyruvate carboxykinase (GTP)